MMVAGFASGLPTCFSPLFVGAGVAINAIRSEIASLKGFSPLFVGAGVAISR